jgi:hypothetical protein
MRKFPVSPVSALIFAKDNLRGAVQSSNRVLSSSFDGNTAQAIDSLTFCINGS